MFEQFGHPRAMVGAIPEAEAALDVLAIMSNTAQFFAIIN